MARRNPHLAVVTLPPVNPPELISDEVQSINYRHAADGVDYVHQFGPGVEMEALENGYLALKHGSADVLHRDFSGQTFLVNPPRRRPMAAKRRHYKSGPKKGQFMPGKAVAKRKSTTTKRKSSSRSSPKRKTTRRRNPPRLTARAITKSLMDGTMDAGLVLAGKAATRSIPIAANLPKEGNIGLAVQALTAVVVGLVAGRMLTPARARMILAGGLTGPLETLIVSYNVPFLAPALSPTEGDAQVSAYMEGYVPVPEIEEGDVSGYADELGMYDHAIYA